jgi:hypothetical protein
VIEFAGASPIDATINSNNGDVQIKVGDTKVEVPTPNYIYNNNGGPTISNNGIGTESKTLTIKKVTLVKEATTPDASIVYYNPTYLLGDANADKIAFYSRNTNMYGGTVREVTEDEMKTTQDGKTCLNLKFFKDLAGQGYHPITTDLKTWVKWQAACDHYYSDWIVTLTKAERITTEEWDVRIMAEDLSATAVNYLEGEEKDSDWDFNDVVFDVKFDKDGNGGTIRLVAAGGVLPLTVAGHEVHHEFDSQYPANPADDYLYPMINTGAGPNLPYVTFHVDNADKTNNGKGIKIMARKQLSDGSTEWFELRANMGQPAAKFAVPSTVDYCSERLHITRKYKNFGEWVIGNLYVWYSDND